MPASLLCAFAAYELVLLTASVVLPSVPGAYAPAVVARLLGINVAAFLLLGLLLRLADSHALRRVAGAGRA